VDTLHKLGGLDLGFKNTKEHLDLSLGVLQSGGTVIFEPESLVTYRTPPPLHWTDIPFYMLRWSDEWERTSLDRLREKWNLTNDEKYFKRRYKHIGWRRWKYLVVPFTRKLFGESVPLWVQRGFGFVEKLLNRMLTTLYRLTERR
jgi:hypothetical protein